MTEAAELLKGVIILAQLIWSPKPPKEPEYKVDEYILERYDDHNAEGYFKIDNPHFGPYLIIALFVLLGLVAFILQLMGYGF